MNNTPTPRERFRKTLDIPTGVSELLADSNASYISWLETELSAVTEQRDKYHDYWESFGEERIKLKTELAAVTEQRDKLAEAIRKHKDTLHFTPHLCDIELYYALQSLNQPTP